MTKVAEHNENKQKEMIIPKDKDRNEYEQRNLTDEQFEIAFVVLDKIREWLDIAIHGKKDNCEFKPLRLTVMGQAGTGKTVLINTLVTVIRKMFGLNNTVHVATPTGSSAFSVQGQTLHRLFQIDIRNPDNEMSPLQKELLGKLLNTTLALFFDERSLISQQVLGTCEVHARKTAHNFGHENEDWGGIPVVILFGDDYQLPPVIHAGAFNVFKAPKGGKYSAMTVNGRRQFLLFSGNFVILCCSNIFAIFWY